jgi:uncharacterized protein YuzB (UPF0349 family)
MKKITFCEQNLEFGSKAVLDYANTHLSKSFNIRTARCLGECGLCFSSIIVDFHGKLLVSKTTDDMINQVAAYAKELQDQEAL